MRLARRRLLLLLAGTGAVLIAVFGAVLLALPWLVDLPDVQALLRTEASRLLDRPVLFERVALSYWPLPAVRIQRLTVASASGFGPDPFLSVEEVRVRVRLLPLLRGRLQFGEVTLGRPRVVVEQRRDGTWNLPTPGGARPAPAAPFVLVSRVRLREGYVEFRVPDESGRSVATHLVDRIDLTLDDLGWSAPIGFRLAARLPGGSITAELEGTLGPLAQAGADLAAIPARAVARFTAEEARPVGASFAMSGSGRGEVRVAGTLGHMTGGGRLAFARLVVAHRPASCPGDHLRSLTLEDLQIPVEVDGSRLALRPFTVRLAGGSVQGDATLTWRAGTPGVRLVDVRVQGVAAEPVLVDFLCQPYAVTGRIDGTGEVAFTGIGDELLRSARGTWALRVGQGRLVGPAMLKLLTGLVRIGTALYAVATLDPSRGLLVSPLEFQSLVASGSLGGGELRVRDVSMQSHDLRMSGAGTYGLLDTRLDLDVKLQGGRANVAVKVGGTAREPTYTVGSGGGLKGVTDLLGPLLGGRRKPPPAASPPAGASREAR